MIIGRMVGWLNEKRLIPLVTNSRRCLCNDTTRQWQILTEFHRIQIAPHSMNFLWSLVGAYVNKQWGAEMILHGGRRRLIDWFLQQTALLCASFYSAHIAYKKRISRIKLKKRLYLCFAIEIRWDSSRYYLGHTFRNFHLTGI